MGRTGQGGFLAHLTLQTLESLAGHCSKSRVYFRATEVGGGPVADTLSKYPKFLIQPAPPQARQLPAWPRSCARAGAVAAWGPCRLAQGGGDADTGGRAAFSFFSFGFLFFLFSFFCFLFCSNAWLFISQAEANRRLLCKLFISRNVAC